MFTLKTLQEHEKEWKELGEAFKEWEQRTHGVVVFDNVRNKHYFPRVWLDAMRRDPKLVGLAERFEPLDSRDLAPPSPRIAELCKVLELPLYVGLFKPQKPRRERTRCTWCGSWAKLDEERQEFVCSGCGATAKANASA